MAPDSFTFVDKNLTQDSDLHLASLNVDALSANIPLDETIDICIDKPFLNPETLVKGISKNGFCDLLNLATKESFFKFNIVLHSCRWCCYGVPSRFNIAKHFPFPISTNSFRKYKH